MKTAGLTTGVFVVYLMALYTVLTISEASNGKVTVDNELKRLEVGLSRKTTEVSEYSVCSQHSNQAPHGSVSYRHWQLFVKPGMNVMPTDNFTS